MMADLLLRTAHATCPVETGAQDGLPIPVAVPVEMKLPHAAHAAGAISRQVDNIRHTAIFFMVSSLTLTALLRIGNTPCSAKMTCWATCIALIYIGANGGTEISCWDRFS
jgi:hypothetical protein